MVDGTWYIHARLCLRGFLDMQAALLAVAAANLLNVDTDQLETLTGVATTALLLE